MRWPSWLRRRDPAPEPPQGNGAAAAAAKRQAQVKLRKAEGDDPVVEHVARRMAQLSPDEFARQVKQAWGRHA